MSVFKAVSLSRASICGLSAVGVFWGGFSAFIPEYKARVHASDAELGGALMMAAVGGIIAMSAGPVILRRLGRATLPAAAAFLVLALSLPLMVSSVPQLALAVLGMGISVSNLDIATNLRISDLEERSGLHLMNLNHAMFSFAFALSAFVASLIRRAGGGPEDLFPLAAGAILLLAVGTIEGQGWTRAPDTPDDADHKGIWSAILPVAAILFIAFVFENATDSWSALHIERTLGAKVGEGGFGPTMLGLTMGIGRLSGQLVAQKLGEAGLIFWSAVVGVLGALTLALAWTPAVGIVGVGLMGLGVAVSVPSANSILGKMVRADQRGFAISRAWMIGFTGFFVGPTMIGQISQLVGLRWAFGWVAGMMLLVLPCVIYLKRKTDQL